MTDHGVQRSNLPVPIAGIGFSILKYTVEDGLGYNGHSVITILRVRCVDHSLFFIRL